MQVSQLFLLCITLYGASAQVSDWGLDEGLIMEMQEQFGNPLKHALEGISVLMDYRGPAIDTSPHRDKESSNDTLELSTEGNEALRYYLPSSNSNISENCKHDVLEFQKALKVLTSKKPRLWSTLMVDSWGKLPDGYISGNSMPLGMMEECTAITVDDHEEIGVISPVKFNATFKGKYCFVIHGLPLGDAMPQGQAGPGIPVSSGNIFNNMFYGSTYGTCMPDSCTSEDFKVSLEEVLPAGHVARAVDCHTKDEELTWESKDYLFMGVMGFIAFLVVFAAAVDLTINYMDTQDFWKSFGPLRYLLVFSAYTNMSKIFHINTTASQGNIGCLHGMRVLTFTWVLMCHQYSYTMYLIENPGNVAYMFNDILGQTILAATPSVDTFFFLSGLLVAYGLMRNKDKMDLYGFVMFYVHRFLRLAPPIAAVCFFTATVTRLLFEGPIGDIYGRAIVDACADNWWYDVFFINNLALKSCLGQTWYTSVDMQMYVMLPIMFFPIMYYEKIGLIWLAFMTLVSFAIPTVINHVYQFPLGSLVIPQDKMEDFYFFLYEGPWSRFSPYLIGLFTGYIIYKTANKKVTMTMWQVVLGWVLSAGIGLLVIYGGYPYNSLDIETFAQNRVPTQAISDVYNGFNRGAWGLALMWLVLACHYGYGGLVNSFLAHPSWQPMSRLTYGMFLVSITIQSLIIGSQYSQEYYDHLTVIIITCGTLFICACGACVLSLLVEGPVLGLEKLLFTKQDKKKKDSPVNEEEVNKTHDILNVEAPVGDKLN